MMLRHVFILLLSSLSTGTNADNPASEFSPSLIIEVFNHGPIPASEFTVPGTQVKLQNLKLADDINAQSPDFDFEPNNPESLNSVKKQAAVWMRSPQGQAHQKQLREAWKPVERLFDCGIEKLPAITFENCKYVVYGTTNVRQALADYTAQRRNRGVTYE
jgi:integrating conjugative element protein (TIGR03757 family)